MRCRQRHLPDRTRRGAHVSFISSLTGRPSYSKDDDTTDDASHNNEDDSTEQDRQGSLLLQAEIYGPEKLLQVDVSKADSEKELGQRHTGRGMESKYRSVMTSGIRTERT
jgi:hypothetical protein